MIADGSPTRCACVVRRGVILVGVSPTATLHRRRRRACGAGGAVRGKAPAYHRHYSHTAKGTTYSFLLEGPFEFFAVHGGSVRRGDGLCFLDRVMSAFLKSLKAGLELLAAGVASPRKP